MRGFCLLALLFAAVSAKTCTYSWQCSSTSSGLGLCSSGQCVCNAPFIWSDATQTCTCASPRILRWISLGATCLAPGECFTTDQCAWPATCQTVGSSFPTVPGVCSTSTTTPPPTVGPTVDPLGTAACVIPGVRSIDNTMRVSMAFYADDWGHTVHNYPRCVMFPTSAQQVSLIVRHAKKFNLKIAFKGNEGHSTNGQSQSLNGIVIDTNGLNVTQVNAAGGWARFGAGLEWEDVFITLNLQGLRPLAQAFTTEVNLAGSVSIGGTSPLSLHNGLVVDHILEMEVVDGNGNILTVSPTQNVALFNAIRGGLGQFAAIVSIKLPITPIVPVDVGVYQAQLAQVTSITTPTFPMPVCPLPSVASGDVIEYFFLWLSPQAFYQGVKILATLPQLDGLETFVLPNNGAVLNTLVPPSLLPCMASLLNLFSQNSGGQMPPFLFFAMAVDMGPQISVMDLLSVIGGSNATLLFSTPLSFFEYSMFQSAVLEKYEDNDLYWRPRSSFNVFVPLVEAEPFFYAMLNAVLSNAQNTSNPNWAIAVSPYWASGMSADQGLTQIPKTWPLLAKFEMFYGGNAPEGSVHESLYLQTANFKYTTAQILYDQILATFPTAKFYPMDRPPYSWQTHFGTQWATAVNAKNTYDPSRVFGATTLRIFD